MPLAKVCWADMEDEDVVDDGWVVAGKARAERSARGGMDRWWRAEVAKVEKMRNVVWAWGGERRVGDWVCEHCFTYRFARENVCRCCGSEEGVAAGILFGAKAVVPEKAADEAADKREEAAMQDVHLQASKLAEAEEVETSEFHFPLLPSVARAVTEPLRNAAETSCKAVPEKEATGSGDNTEDAVKGTAKKDAETAGDRVVEEVDTSKLHFPPLASMPRAKAVAGPTCGMAASCRSAAQYCGGSVLARNYCHSRRRQRGTGEAVQEGPPQIAQAREEQERASTTVLEGAEHRAIEPLPSVSHAEEVAEPTCCVAASCCSPAPCLCFRVSAVARSRSHTRRRRAETGEADEDGPPQSAQAREQETASTTVLQCSEHRATESGLSRGKCVCLLCRVAPLQRAERAKEERLRRRRRQREEWREERRRLRRTQRSLKRAAQVRAHKKRGMGAGPRVGATGDGSLFARRPRHRCGRSRRADAAGALFAVRGP